MLLVGLLLVGSGVVLLILPGPGLLLILAGLAVLGTEFEMARRAQRKLLVKARQTTARARGGGREHLVPPPSELPRAEGGIEPPLHPPH